MISAQDKIDAPRRPRRSSAEVMARILSAAAGEFEDRGYAGATTAAIAARAEVTEAQLFRYFASKAALFREAVAKPLDERFAAFNARQLADAAHAGDYADATRRYIHELQQFLDAQSGLLLSLIVARAHASGGIERDDRFGSLESYFDRGAAVMSSRVRANATVDPQLMVRVSFAAVLGAVLFKDWLFPAGFARDSDIEGAVVRFVIDGINSNQLSRGSD